MKLSAASTVSLPSSRTPRRRALVAAVALAFGAFAAPAAQAGALLDIYGQALANDKTLQAAGFARDAVLQTKPAARAAFLPQIAGQADYTYQDSSSSSSSARFGAGTSSLVDIDSTTTARNLGLTLSQALFNWEAIRRYQQADDQIALAETNYRLTRQQLALRVAQAYFNVLAARDFVSFAEAENLSVGRQLEQSQQRFEVGLSAITDVQEAQSRFDLTTAQKIDAETALANANRALTEITAAPENRVNPVVEDFPLTTPEPRAPQQWIDAARRNNLSVLGSRLIAEVAKDDVKIFRARHLPTLALEGGYSDSDGDEDTSTVLSGAGIDCTTTVCNSNLDAPTSSRGARISVVARLPIYAGGAVQASVRSAEAVYEQRRREFEAAERAAERGAGDAYQGVVAGIGRVTALKAAVKSSLTALEASQVGLQVGARTSIDVLNAQREVSNAQRNYAQARYNYLLSVLTLKQAAGTLDRPDLGEIDRLLTDSERTSETGLPGAAAPGAYSPSDVVPVAPAAPEPAAKSRSRGKKATRGTGAAPSRSRAATGAGAGAAVEGGSDIVPGTSLPRPGTRADARTTPKDAAAAEAASGQRDAAGADAARRSREAADQAARSTGQRGTAAADGSNAPAGNVEAGQPVSPQSDPAAAGTAVPGARSRGPVLSPRISPASPANPLGTAAPGARVGGTAGVPAQPSPALTPQPSPTPVNPPPAPPPLR